MTTALTACTEATLETTKVDLSQVKDKRDHPLSDEIVADMRAKGMEKQSPIAIRIFKEEGVLEIWKAKSNDRFDKIKEYKICAWSGRLGPKVKEGDRQAPEGFYDLSPANLNPNSSYYLAINTGFPNKFDRANQRSGTNLMIHGACSSSGCYSMTDEQVLEIYAFARDAFKGGQKTVQLQAFPFRMTAENMARHRLSEHYDFWKMLKVGYDNFEVTKRPPEVNVCEKKYVFNQQLEGKGSFNPTGACPATVTPPALSSALTAYNKVFDTNYDKAVSKLRDKVWYDPTEAERKAVVAKQRKGRELAYAPTGTALEAGRLMKISEFAALNANAAAAPTPTSTGVSASVTAPQVSQVASVQQGATAQPAVPAQTGMAARGASMPAAGDTAPSVQATGGIPVPTPNPLKPPEPQMMAQQPPAKKPFWKFWAAQ